MCKFASWQGADSAAMHPSLLLRCSEACTETVQLARRHQCVRFQIEDLERNPAFQALI